MSVISNSQLNYLRDLSIRLAAKGFSWQPEDYRNLKEMVPVILCHICVHGNKNEGTPCWDCFQERHFEYYLNEMLPGELKETEI